MPRLRKPEVLKALEGYPDKRHRKHEPQRVELTPAGLPEHSLFISDQAKKIWDRLTLAMVQGLWTACDELLLETYCENGALVILAAKVLREEGYLVEGSQGQMVISPWHRIFDAASAKLASLGARLGLDPISRISLPAELDKEKANPFGIE